MKGKVKKLIAGIALATTIFAVGCTKEQTKETFYTRPEVKTADEALKLLKEGNERFSTDKPANINVGDSKRDELVKGQKPFAIVVGCSDSRVTPTILFDQGLGDIFEIRIAGNVVDDNAMGSIEYAVEHLHAPLIVVLGHEKCGAVTATAEVVEANSKAPGSIGALVDKIKPSVVKVKNENKELQKGDLVEKAATENVKSVVKSLETSDIIKEKLEKGEVKVVGAKYLLDDGKLEWINQ